MPTINELLAQLSALSHPTTRPDPEADHGQADAILLAIIDILAVPSLAQQIRRDFDAIEKYYA